MITSLKNTRKTLKKAIPGILIPDWFPKNNSCGRKPFFPDQDCKTKTKQPKKKSNLTQTNRQNTVLKMQPPQLIGNG